MKDISIFIQKHADVAHENLPDHYTLQVGGLYSHKDLKCDFSDVNGDNISAKNRTYVDLCGVYWIWKNVKDSKYVGNCHYSKYWNLTSSDALDILKEHDIIIPIAILPGRTVYQIFCDFHGAGPIDTARDIISDLYPDYVKDFDDTIINDEISTLYNMMICSKDIWDSYCSWLFPILFELENCYYIPEDASGFDASVPGYIAERLLMVWINHNKLDWVEGEIKRFCDKLK